MLDGPVPGVQKKLQAGVRGLGRGCFGGPRLHRPLQSPQQLGRRPRLRQRAEEREPRGHLQRRQHLFRELDSAGTVFPGVVPKAAQADLPDVQRVAQPRLVDDTGTVASDRWYLWAQLDINQSSETISVGKFLAAVNQIKEGLINLEQQDAHELYAAIIGAVETVLNKQKRVDLSASVRLLEEEQEQEEAL